MIIKIILIATALSGFVYCFYSQIQARKYISKEKIAELKDTSIIANGPMPRKEILSEEGQKYHKGFCIGSAIFIMSLIALVIITKFF